MDREIQDLLQKVKEANRKPFWQSTPQEARSGPMLMALLFGEPPAVERDESFTIPSSQGFDLPVRLYVPSKAPKGLIVYFHGGGWVIGTVAGYHPFTATLANRTGCGVLLDVNNIYVSARNHGFDPNAYLRAIPRHVVREIHLAGFTVNRCDDGELLVDTHNRRVWPAVWTLYRQAVQRFGPIPTLIEWDTNTPDYAVYMAEADKAQAILDAVAV